MQGAAKATLAARHQGEYKAFHWALMRLKQRAEKASVLRVAKEVGLDIGQLRADMEAPEVQSHIDRSMRLAQALGFSGTPSFVIGENLVPGLVKLDPSEALVEKVRASE